MSPRVASRRWWLALRQAPRPPCGRSGGCSPRCWCRPTAARRRPKSTVDAHGSETLPPQRLRLRALSDFPPLSYSPLLLGWKMRGASPSLWLSGGVPRTPPNRRKQSPTLVETDLSYRPIASAPVNAGTACYRLGANARSACAFVRIGACGSLAPSRELRSLGSRDHDGRPRQARRGGVPPPSGRPALDRTGAEPDFATAAS